MIPDGATIYSLHHLMLSVCSAAPKSVDELCAVAVRRQRRAGVQESDCVCTDLCVRALDNLHAFKFLALSGQGYRLTVQGEKKLIALDAWVDKQGAA